MFCKYLPVLCLFAPLVCLQDRSDRLNSKSQVTLDLCLASVAHRRHMQMPSSQSKSLLDSAQKRDKHCPNPPQKRYEVLRDFVGFMAKHPTLRWSMGAGALLGAMRQEPPGFIPQDDDIDVYMPARDLFAMQDIAMQELPLGRDIGPAARFTPTDECCGFGWRIVHRDDECSYMDLMGFSLQDQPFDNQKIDGQKIDVHGQKIWAIPQDQGKMFHLDAMMLQRQQWEERQDSVPDEMGPEWKWNGNQTTLFTNVYIFENELLPFTQRQMYGLSVNIPQRPVDILNRLYGTNCMVRDDHGHDLTKDSKWLRPADVNPHSVLQVGQRGWIRNVNP